MAYMNGRSSFDVLGGSLPGVALGHGLGLEDEVVRQEDEGETASHASLRQNVTSLISGLGTGG
jgi:hypothetical protein